MEFTERLWAPVSWWLVALAFALVFGVAVLFFLGPWWGIGVAVGCAAVIIAVLVGYGRAPVAVSAHGLRAGRSFIEWRYVAAVTALEAEAMRVRLGPGADRRAFLAVRPYIHTGVEVTLDDPDDPHPYWLVASRHPQRLAGTARAHLVSSPETTPPHRPHSTTGADPDGEPDRS